MKCKDVVFEKTLKLICQLYILAHNTETQGESEEWMPIISAENSRKLIDMLINTYLIDDKPEEKESQADADKRDAFITVVLNNLELVVEHCPPGGAKQGESYAEIVSSAFIDRMKDFDAKLKERILAKGILRDERSVTYSLACVLDYVEGRMSGDASSMDAWLMPLSKYNSEGSSNIEDTLKEYLSKFLQAAQELEDSPTGKPFHVKVMKTIIQK